LVSFFGFEGDVKILCTNPQTALACVNTGLLVYCMLKQGITATRYHSDNWCRECQLLDWRWPIHRLAQTFRSTCEAISRKRRDFGSRWSCITQVTGGCWVQQTILSSWYL